MSDRSGSYSNEHKIEVFAGLLSDQWSSDLVFGEERVDVLLDLELELGVQRPGRRRDAPRYHDPVSGRFVKRTELEKRQRAARVSFDQWGGKLARAIRERDKRKSAKARAPFEREIEKAHRWRRYYNAIIIDTRTAFEQSDARGTRWQYRWSINYAVKRQEVLVDIVIRKPKWVRGSGPEIRAAFGALTNPDRWAEYEERGWRVVLVDYSHERIEGRRRR